MSCLDPSLDSPPSPYIYAPLLPTLDRFDLMGSLWSGRLILPWAELVLLPSEKLSLSHYLVGSHQYNPTSVWIWRGIFVY
ncbi:unnamed protein product [Brassica oleracea var. botrytis]|uniref:Uncharacterized protein n=2 Tax=Brassica oleracea TaxID=3712 RepID=A0A0D2ZUB3_BRAOL|nr:unnamed protein product [Brassica oleracea]